MKVPHYFDRDAIDLCAAFAWEDLEAPKGTRDTGLWMEDGTLKVLRVDPRNVHDYTDDDAMANARAAAFAVLRCCAAIDGRHYRIIDPDGNECLPVMSEPSAHGARKA